MLCDRCHGREAVVHVTQIINGHRTELHLCEECARKERGVHRSFGTFGPHMFRSPLESFFEGRMPSFFGRSPIEIEAMPEEREEPMFSEGLRRSPESYYEQAAHIRDEMKKLEK